MSSKLKKKLKPSNEGWFMNIVTNMYNYLNNQIQTMNTVPLFLQTTPQQLKSQSNYKFDMGTKLDLSLSNLEANTISGIEQTPISNIEQIPISTYKLDIIPELNA